MVRNWSEVRVLWQGLRVAGLGSQLEVSTGSECMRRLGVRRVRNTNEPAGDQLQVMLGLGLGLGYLSLRLAAMDLQDRDARCGHELGVVLCQASSGEEGDDLVLRVTSVLVQKGEDVLELLVQRHDRHGLSDLRAEDRAGKRVTTGTCGWSQVGKRLCEGEGRERHVPRP